MLRIIVTLLIVGIGLLALVRWLEPRLAFFPSAGETETPADYSVAFTPATITTRDGERLRAWLLKADAPRAFVVYFHGNGGNLSMWAPILADLSRHGYDVLAFDYRGYGASTGRPTESGLYRDADAILEHAASTRPGSLPIVYWGRSLGTAIAAYAASRTPPDGVILEAGFPSGLDVVRSSPVLAVLSVFASYRFGTSAWLDNVRTPVLVMHGDADQVIPFRHGRDLFERVKGQKTFLTIPGGDHNDLKPADERVYWQAVETFIQKTQG